MRRTERSKLPLSDLIDWTIVSRDRCEAPFKNPAARPSAMTFSTMATILERAIRCARAVVREVFRLASRSTTSASGLEITSGDDLAGDVGAPVVSHGPMGRTPAQDRRLLILNPKGPWCESPRRKGRRFILTGSRGVTGRRLRADAGAFASSAELRKPPSRTLRRVTIPTRLIDEISRSAG